MTLYTDGTFTTKTAQLMFTLENYLKEVKNTGDYTHSPGWRWELMPNSTVHEWRSMECDYTY